MAGLNFWIDLIIENEEVLMIKKADGLNGNEKWAWINMGAKKDLSEI